LETLLVNANTTVAKAGTLTTGNAVRTIMVADGVTLTWTGQIFSTAAGTGFIKSRNGTWDMSSESAAYPSGFTLNAGTMIVSGKNSFGNGAMNINGGTIQSSGISAFAPASLAIGGNFTFAGTGNDTGTMPISLGATTPNITNITTSGSRILIGLISGNAGTGLNFFGSGTGQIYIGNSGNTFSGLITINGTNSAPEIGFANDGSFGAVPSSVTTNAIVIDGGRLTFSDTNGNAIAYMVNANRGIQVGEIAGTSISVAKTNGFLAYAGVIADKPGSAGILVKQGAGALVVGGTNTYSGRTFINNGTLQLTNSDNRLPVGTTVNLGQSGSVNLGTLDLNGNNQQVAGLNSTSGDNTGTARNTIINSADATSTLTLSNITICAYGDGSLTNSGIITGAINLVENGPGTQILGNINTYTGTTTVNAGTLALSGVGSIGGTPEISVAAGASLDVSARINGTLILVAGQQLDGFGTVTGLVATSSGSTIAPGSSNTIGTLTVSSNLTLNGVSMLKLNKTGATNDVLSASGILTLGGTLVVTNLSGTLASGDSFKLFKAATIASSFSATNLPALNAGLSWTNTLGVNGTLSVVGSSASVSYLAINNFSVSGTNLMIGGTN
jgi:autotransporter-associated beta strand protein